MQLLLTDDSSLCTKTLVDRLTVELQRRDQVLWFMTGGSNIAVDVAVMDQLEAELTRKLIVTLTDERYGDYGHADSNWQQLQEQGLDLKHARAFSILQESNPNLETTTELYADNLKRTLSEVDAVIGFYGLGTDGHIAGILPRTPAVLAEGLATGYTTDTFVRITSTFETIRRCNAAYMYTAGEGKHQALEQLQQIIPLAEQPAQILKELPEAYVFNDWIGEES